MTTFIMCAYRGPSERETGDRPGSEDLSAAKEKGAVVCSFKGQEGDSHGDGIAGGWKTELR